MQGNISVRIRNITAVAALFFSCLQTGMTQPASAEHIHEHLQLPGYQVLFEDEDQLVEKKLHEIRSWRTMYPDSAEQRYRQMLRYYLRKNRSLSSIRIMLGLSDFYTREARYNEALRMLRFGLSYSTRRGETHQSPFFYNHLAHIYQIRGTYDTAAYFMLKGLIANEAKPVISRSYFYNNLAIILMDVEAFESAWYYLEKAEEHLAGAPGSELAGGILLQKGSILLRQKKYREAEAVYDSALLLAGRLALPAMKHVALTGLADLKVVQKQYTEAITLLEEAGALKDSIPTVDFNNSDIILGSVYIFTGHYGKAEQMLLHALQTARTNRNASELQTLYFNLADIYSRTQKWEDAYKFQKLYQQARDSFQHSRLRQHISQMEVKYRTAQKDREIADKELQIVRGDSLNRTVLLAMGSTFIVFLLFFIYKQRLQRARMNAMRQEEKLRSLNAFIHGEENERSRIANELHDGVGGLLSTTRMYLEELRMQQPQVIQALVYTESLSLVDESIQQIRSTAHMLMPELVVRFGLSEAISRYCAKVEGGGRLKIRFQSYGPEISAHAEFELSVYRMVQELIQNVIRHANAVSVLVQISTHNGVLGITVEDDGSGISENPQEGMGLATIRTRVENLKGSFSIRSLKEKGTIAYLEFDLQKDQQSPA